MIEREIPMTTGVVPLDVLTTPGLIAQGIEGLPTDPLSIQNGAIMTSGAVGADDRPAAAGHPMDQREVG